MNPVTVLNKSSLAACGPQVLRTHAVEIIEAAIQNADPYRAALKDISLKDDILTVQSMEYDLRQRENVYILGVGKATQKIALALEEVLGSRLTGGLVVLKRGEKNILKRVEVIHAAHPVPDEGSLKGGMELMRLARQAGKDDLVISIITGGSSSLAVVPPVGVTLEDKRTLNRLLLECGATIFEINAVRKHVSLIKGGRLAQEIFPAELLSLTVSDVVGDALDYITDLTVPDTSTYKNAWATLDKYDLWGKIPASIREYLQSGEAIESPKAFSGRYHTCLLVPGDAAFSGAVKACLDLGYETRTKAEEVEGDCRAEAHALIMEAEQWAQSSLPSAPCALVSSGETTVLMENNSGGLGGPNQEFALAAALEIAGHGGIVVAAVDVDGTDGPTDAAGGLVDGASVSRALAQGLDPIRHLQDHSSLELLQASSDLVITGPTGTNVNDIMFILFDPGSSR